MLVIALLVLIGMTIVAVRLYVNGLLEEPQVGARRTPAPATAAAGRVVAPAAAAPRMATSRTAASRRKAGAAAAAVWEGGPCPSCGAETVAGAKFCGECGQRLVP